MRPRPPSSESRNADSSITIGRKHHLCWTRCFEPKSPPVWMGALIDFHRMLRGGLLPFRTAKSHHRCSPSRVFDVVFPRSGQYYLHHGCACAGRRCLKCPCQLSGEFHHSMGPLGADCPSESSGGRPDSCQSRPRIQ